MPVQPITLPAITAHHSFTASRATYENADDQAYWDTYEAHLDALADAAHGTLEIALEALRVIVADAIDCGLFVGTCRAHQRVFQAACNVTDLAEAAAH